MFAHPAVLCLLLAAATLAVYWPAIRCDFVNYDDPGYFFSNDHVLGGLTLANLAGLSPRCSRQLAPADVDFVDAGCGGVWQGSGGPHFTNLLFHLANTVLLFLLLRRLTQAPWRSAFAAALFGLHPLHVESVAWISERKDVLSTFFGLLTLLFYAGYARRMTSDGWPVTRAEETAPTSDMSHVTRHTSLFYVFALLFFALGLMSKAMLVTLPFVMLLLDTWPL